MSRCGICGGMCCAGNAEELEAKDARIAKLEAVAKAAMGVIHSPNAKPLRELASALAALKGGGE